MDYQKSTDANFSFYQGIYENSGLWSCLGYDGLSMAFDLALEDVRSLTEAQKHSLMDLLASLAKRRDESLTVRVRALEGLPSDERLMGLITLSARV